MNIHKICKIINAEGVELDFDTFHKVVYIYMRKKFSKAELKGNYYYESCKDIAYSLGMNERTINRKFKDFREVGLLLTEKHKTSDNGYARTYYKFTDIEDDDLFVKFDINGKLIKAKEKS